MKYIKTLILIYALIHGCLISDYCYAGKKYRTNKGFLGVNVYPNENNVVFISSVVKKTAADKSALKKGDIILEADDGISKTSDVGGFRKMLMNSKAGSTIKLKIKRGKKIIEKNIKLRGAPYVLSPVEKLDSLAWKGEKVVLLTEIKEPQNNYLHLPYNFDRRSWISQTKTNLEDIYRKDFLNWEKVYKNFKLYDKDKLERALEKIRTLSHEYDGESGKFKLMKEVGITHMLEIAFVRHGTSNYAYYDEIRLKLIDVKTGETVDIDKGHTKYDSRDRVLEEFRPVYVTD